MNEFSSIEEKWLVEKIEKNIKFLQTCKNPAQYRAVEKDTLFLKNHILPIILKNTSLVWDEIIRYVVKCVQTALKYKCNGLILYVPLSDNYKDKPLIGIANSRDEYEIGRRGAIQIYVNHVEILNTDGSGTENVECFPLNLEGL